MKTERLKQLSRKKGKDLGDMGTFRTVQRNISFLCIVVDHAVVSLLMKLIIYIHSNIVSILVIEQR